MKDNPVLRVFLKAGTYWEPIVSDFPNGFPCLGMVEHPNKKEKGDRLGFKLDFQFCSEHQTKLICNLIGHVYKVPAIEVIGNQVIIYEKHVKKCLDIDGFEWDIYELWLAQKTYLNAEQLSLVSTTLSGQEWHSLICLAQLGLRHPYAKNSVTSERAKQATLKLIDFIGRDDKEIKDFYLKGFDPNFDVTIP